MKILTLYLTRNQINSILKIKETHFLDSLPYEDINFKTKYFKVYSENLYYKKIIQRDIRDYEKYFSFSTGKSLIL